MSLILSWSYEWHKTFNVNSVAFLFSSADGISALNDGEISSSAVVFLSLKLQPINDKENIKKL